jgi:hypothetical protein
LLFSVFIRVECLAVCKIAVGISGSKSQGGEEDSGWIDAEDVISAFL